MPSLWLEDAFEEATYIAKKNLKKELDDKTSFLRQICDTDGFPEQIALVMYKECVSLEEMKRVSGSYLDPTIKFQKMCPELELSVLEEKVLLVSSKSRLTKEEQRQHALEMLGSTLTTMDVFEEENKSGVITLWSKVVASLCKTISEEFLEKDQTENISSIKKEMDERLERRQKLENPILQEAMLVEEKNLRERLACEREKPVLTAIVLGLLKTDVSTPLIYELITQLDHTYFAPWYEFPDVVDMSKALFLKLCKLCVRV